MEDFLGDLVKNVGNNYAGVIDDGIIGDDGIFYDTGSYTLNALTSGSIYGGFPSKITVLAGESTTGKTYLLLSMLKRFQEKYPTGNIVFFESESALTRRMFEERGFDMKRIALFPVSTVQEFRTQALRVLNSYDKVPKSKRKPLFMCLDSLGNLSTQKEIDDIDDGKDTRDMTRAQLVRGAFRVLTLRLGQLGVPMVITNHTYTTMGLFASKKMGGGDGPLYSASTVLFLSKKKETEGSEVTGNVIKVLQKKGRVTKENKQIETLIDYERGLSKHYGLIDLALKFGVWKKVAKKIEYAEGKMAYETSINKNPEKYFTEEVLTQIESYVKGEFEYGTRESTDPAAGGEDAPDDAGGEE